MCESYKRQVKLPKYIQLLQANLQFITVPPLIRNKDGEKAWAETVSLQPNNLPWDQARLYISCKERSRAYTKALALLSNLHYLQGSLPLLWRPSLPGRACSGTKQTALLTHLCTHSPQWGRVALGCHSSSFLGPVPRQPWGLALYLFPYSRTSLLSPKASRSYQHPPKAP